MFRWLSGLLFAIFVGLALGASAAWAQDFLLSQLAQTSDPRIDPRTERRIRYVDILEHPDDIDLNFRYARQQIEDGNVKGASATLQRILLINPDLPLVRLLYGIVLFQLGDDENAKSEFDIILQYDPPVEVKAEVDRYLGRIASGQKRTRWDASISLGMRYDWNVNSTPGSGEQLFFDLPFTSLGREDDTALLAVTRIGFRHDLGFQDQHEVFGSATYHQLEQTTADQLDIQLASLEFGGTYRGVWADYTGVIRGDVIRLSRERYARIGGAQLRMDKRFSPVLLAFSQVAAQWEEYQDSSATALADERTGLRLGGIAGLKYKITPQDELEISFEHVFKDAHEEFQSYDAEQLTASLVHVFSGGDYVLAAAVGRLTSYDAPDPFISVDDRDDRSLRLRLTYGMPLRELFLPLRELFLYQLPEELDNMMVAVTGEYLNQDSSIENFSYENYRTEAIVSGRWEF